ncbi:MAG: hypothetical protein O8C62_00410 [Candidatus Methanoperedens sp.]|nr:hypothetical protein [Candidatus Methanoperedens sp.]
MYLYVIYSSVIDLHNPFDNIHDFKRQPNFSRCHLPPRPSTGSGTSSGSHGKSPSHRCGLREFGSNGIFLHRERIGAGDLIFVEL